MLDRVLVSPEWELQFPLVTIRTLVRGVSDHAALFVSNGIVAPVITKPFKFELSWFMRDDLFSVVKKVWKAPHRGRNALDR
jgi:hypothetical protein